RFHCLYWPALLLSAGLALPRRVYAHGWLTKDRHKISKTTGNTVDPAALARELGSDAVRYYLLSATAFGQDGDYTRHGLVARYTADLANGFGNLVQRATVLASRHAGLAHTTGLLCAADLELRARARALEERVAAAFESLALHDAAAAVRAFVEDANRYAQVTAPWDLAKVGQHDRLAVVLDHLVEAARLAAWYYAPFVPQAAAVAHQRIAGCVPSTGVGSFEVHRRATVQVGPPLFPRLSASG
ncbi:MAG: class I tRNA ligase family protein, partial [Chloroflexi bacterium]|nr:class I tRNA ligase family protein [Chloroflexota bacterium]